MRACKVKRRSSAAVADADTRCHLHSCRASHNSYVPTKHEGVRCAVLTLAQAQDGARKLAPGWLLAGRTVAHQDFVARALSDCSEIQ